MSRVPQRFGKYLLIDRLSRGGMAEIYRARPADGSPGLVAIKRMLPELLDHEELLAMFLDEARLMEHLSHPNIARVYDQGRVGSNYYIALEYVAGVDLRIMFARGRDMGVLMPIPLVAFVIAQLCDALDYAHRRTDHDGRPLSIVHRDVSPENCLVTYDGAVKLVDFGVAKASSQSKQTQTGVLKGKFSYMSPEQVLGQSVDRRSDIFSLGVVLHELLTGRRLFLAESDFATLRAVSKARVEPPSSVNPHVPRALDQAILRSLEKDPARRFQWASEMGDALRLALTAVSPAPSPSHLQKYLSLTFAREVALEREFREALARSHPEVPDAEPVELGPDDFDTAEEPHPTAVERVRPNLVEVMPDLIVPSLLLTPPADPLPPPPPAPGVALPDFEPTSTPMPALVQTPSPTPMDTPVQRRDDGSASRINTRRWRRWPVHMRVKGRFWQRGEDEQPLEALLCTLSQGGAMLRCAAPVRANSTVEFVVPVGLFSGVFVRGDVRWWGRVGSEREIGLEFSEAKPDLQKFLERRHGQ